MERYHAGIRCPERTYGGKQQMKILYVGSEALPFASTGGLGDVLGALPAAVKRALGEGGDVRVVIPMYRCIKEQYLSRCTFVCQTEVWLSWRRQYMGIFSCEKDGVLYYFIDNEYYFYRPALYGDYDDGERFAYFSAAVLKLMACVDFYPDVLHANDWQSALSVIYLKRQFAQREEYRHIRAVYTIHNIAYQGVYGFETLEDLFGLGAWDHGIVEYNGDINLTKGAIVCADRVTTVSPQYAKEICMPYYAHGLHHILQMYREKVCGIVNGIDTAYYNPASDIELAAHYDADHPAGKVRCKTALEELCGFASSASTPIVAMISRLAAHKGFDLVMRVIDEMLQDDMRFVLLGTGEDGIAQFMQGLQARHGDKVSVFLCYDKALSKQIYAGADVFLMPSQSEPCGLSQMIASRYGTVPVVRETGGLYDTIKPYDVLTHNGNGFTFANYNAHEMMDAVRRALALYRDADAWAACVETCMRTDFSWNASAAQYVQMYEDLTR